MHTFFLFPCMFNWFLQLFCADSIFVKHFWHWIAINVQTMWTTELVVSLLPRWWPYQPWASDDCKQRLFCRNIQNLARCCSRRSQIKLFLHRLSKGNELLLLTETVLAWSLCSWSVLAHSTGGIAALKEITSAHTDLRHSTPTYGLQNIGVFLDILPEWFLIFFWGWGTIAPH